MPFENIMGKEENAGFLPLQKQKFHFSITFILSSVKFFQFRPV